MSKANSSSATEPWAAWAESFQKLMANPANLNPFSGVPGVASMPGMTGLPGMAGFPAMPGMPTPDVASLMKSIDPEEINRRINDLRAVESWMKLSLSTLEMSIKTMEMQRDAYASFSKFRETAQQTSQAATDAMARSMGAAAKSAKRNSPRAKPAAQPARKRRAASR